MKTLLEKVGKAFSELEKDSEQAFILEVLSKDMSPSKRKLFRETIKLFYMEGASMGADTMAENLSVRGRWKHFLGMK